MSKLLTALLLAVSISAYADGRGGHGGHGGYNHHGGDPTHYGHYNNYNGYYRGYSSNDVLFGTIVGGVIGYSIAQSQRPQQVIIQQPQIMVQQYSGTIVLPVAPNQPYYIAQFNESPRPAYFLPGNNNGLQYCQPGMTLFFRVSQYARVDTLGCNY